MALLALNLTAFAGGELADPAVGGDWNADATWSGGVRPAAGEAIVVKPTANAKLTMSATDTNAYKSLTFHPSSAINKAASIEFDGNGKTLLMPNSSSGVYESGGAFTFLDGESKQLLTLYQNSMETAAKTTASPVRLTDAHFKLSQTAGGVSSFVLDRGKMDFYTDGGSAVAAREVRLAGQKALSVTVSNAALEVPKFYGACGSYSANYVFDHATFIAHGYARFANDNAWYYANGEVAAKDSTFKFDGGVFFGRASACTFENCTITGGVLNAGWTKQFTFKDCTVDMTGEMSVGPSAAASWADSFAMTIDGGTYSYGKPSLGFQGDVTGILTIKNNATVDWLKSSASVGWRGTGVVEIVSGLLRTAAVTYQDIRLGDRLDQWGVGKGILRMSGGKLHIRIGEVSWADSATDGLAVGGAGVGEVYLSGGEMLLPRLSVGYSVIACQGGTAPAGRIDARLAVTSFVYQTGGKINLGVTGNQARSVFGLSYYSGSGGGSFNDRDVKQKTAYYFNGGELEATYLVGGKGSACQGGTGSSFVSADGGTMRLNYARSASAVNIGGIDRFEVGANGFTLDSNGLEASVGQDIVNKPGAEGLFVKTGEGNLLYSGNLSASDLVVSCGSFTLVSGNVTSRLAVAPGTEFSLAGSATGATLAGLSLSGATIRLDTNDVITVNGSLVWDRLTLAFAQPPAKNQALSFLKLQGAMSEEALDTLNRAFVDTTLADGTHAQFATSYDGGVTTVTLTVVDDAEPIGEGDTITWVGSGNWSSAGNWSPATVPTETKKAAFTSATAGKSVNVNTSAHVGALTFGADGYTLAGSGSVRISGEQGAAQIEATAGTNTVNVPMTFDTIIQIPVAEKKKVTLARPISLGGFNKTGLGTLALAGNNDFVQGVSLAEGTTELGANAALGKSDQVAAAFKSGAIRTVTSDGSAIEIARTVRSYAGTGGLVFDAQTEATIPFESGSGYLYKRGPGDLTLLLGKDNTISQGYNSEYWKFNITFDENGFADPNSELRGALTVAEGLLRIAAKSGLSTRPKLTLARTLNVGGIYAAGKTNPTLELDGVSVLLPNTTTLYVGNGMQSSSNPGLTRATLRLKNNAYLQAWYGNLGYRSHNTIRIELFDSTYYGYVQTYFGGAAGATDFSMLGVNSTFTAGQTLQIVGNVAADYTNTTVQANGGDYRINFQCSYDSARWSGGYLRFAAGSKLLLRSVCWYTSSAAWTKNLRNFKLVFDDGTWDIGNNSMTLSETNDPRVVLSKFSVQLQDGGLKLPVSSGKRIHSDARFWGTGGITKSGEGTLSFGPDAYDFTGPLCVTEGTVDLSNAGLLTNACIGPGAGTIVGGTFRDCSFVLGDEAPTLENCTFENRAIVDVGDEPPEKPYPKDKTLFTFVGPAPDVSGWRLGGGGRKGFTAAFSVVDNEVRVSIGPMGFIFILQ